VFYNNGVAVSQDKLLAMSEMVDNLEKKVTKGGKENNKKSSSKEALCYLYIFFDKYELEQYLGFYYCQIVVG